MPGPKLDVTGPYLEGPGTFAIQMHQLTGPKTPLAWWTIGRAEGVTSFKAYNYLTPQELKAAIDHAHAHGLKITGHLCSIGFREAAALGIDNLEHGLAWTRSSIPARSPGSAPERSP